MFLSDMQDVKTYYQAWDKVNVDRARVHVGAFFA